MPRKIFKVYSWQEIQRHNQEADKWLVINRKVYDVTGWAKRHPGGHQVLNHYAGEDATDVLRAMHLKLDIVKLYLKPLLIGELAPEEPSQERNKNSQLVEGFQELRRTLETMNMFKATQVFFFLHLAQILILETLAWLMVWHFGNGWLTTIFISFLLVISQGQSFFLQHDAGHHSIFTNSKWNQLLQKFLMSHLKYGKKKIKYIDYEKQHIYFYMVEIPFFISVFLNIKSIRVMYFQRYWEDIAWVSSFYIRYFITLGPFYEIFGTVLLIYVVKFLEDPWITNVTQMSHIPMKMSREENRDRLSTQVLATCNVEQSFFNDWFTGHLNFQIKHHLFPAMPRHNYHKVAPLVRALCAKHGLPYVSKPILEAFGDIVSKALKKSAALWRDAYYET